MNRILAILTLLTLGVASCDTPEPTDSTSQAQIAAKPPGQNYGCQRDYKGCMRDCFFSSDPLSAGPCFLQCDQTFWVCTQGGFSGFHGERKTTTEIATVQQAQVQQVQQPAAKPDPVPPVITGSDNNAAICGWYYFRCINDCANQQPLIFWYCSTSCWTTYNRCLFTGSF